MFEKVKALRDRFVGATDEEKAQIQKEMDALKDENPDAWADAMVECMKETNRRLNVLLVKDTLAELLPFISVSAIAKHYFGKSKEWFYQKLNGNIVNGKPAQFSAEEIQTLNNALQDLSKKIGSIRVAS